MSRLECSAVLIAGCYIVVFDVILIEVNPVFVYFKVLVFQGREVL